jgi:hypothetical protein
MVAVVSLSNIFKGIRMLQFSQLVVSLVLLLLFSISREKGKNTKNANGRIQKKTSSQRIDSTEVIQINLVKIRN